MSEYFRLLARIGFSRPFFTVNIFHYLLRGGVGRFFNRSIPRIERCFFWVLIKIDFTIAFSRLL